jgi:acetyl esterase/lipase
VTEWKDPEIVAFRAMMAAMAPPPDAPTPSWEERRAGIDAMGAMAPPPDDCKIEPIKLAGRPAEKITPAGAHRARTLLYLHGGGYCIGGPASHRTLVARLAKAAGATAYVLDYRLAPEHPFPSAVDDAVAAYQALIESGHSAAHTVIGGDSAGGGLTVATAVAARDAGLPTPAGLYLMSPWVNLANASKAYEVKAASDPVINDTNINEFAQAYLGDGDRKRPLASPVHADLTGLPPMLIQVGSEEVLMSDSTLLAEVAGLARVDVTLRIWPEMIHIWPFFAALSAGGRAIEEVGDWIKAKVA